MIWELSLHMYPVLPCLVAHSVQHSSGVSPELLWYKQCRREVQATSKGKICITLPLAKRNGLPADHKLPLYLSWHRALSHSTEKLFRRIQHIQKKLASQRSQERQRTSAKWPLRSSERPTNSSRQDETLRREITTKGCCWSAQHTLRVTLSCPNKGFSKTQQRGTKPQSPQPTASLPCCLCLRQTPNWPTKSASVQVFCFLGKGKWTYVLEIKLFLALFQPFLNGGNNSLASSGGHTGKGSHSLIFMYNRRDLCSLLALCCQSGGKEDKFKLWSRLFQLIFW